MTSKNSPTHLVAQKNVHFATGSTKKLEKLKVGTPLVLTSIQAKKLGGRVTAIGDVEVVDTSKADAEAAEKLAAAEKLEAAETRAADAEAKVVKLEADAAAKVKAEADAAAAAKKTG